MLAILFSTLVACNACPPFNPPILGDQTQLTAPELFDQVNAPFPFISEQFLNMWNEPVINRTDDPITGLNYTTIWVTGEEGLDHGECTERDAPCSLNYVFFSGEFQMPVPARINFEDPATALYPQALINISTPVIIELNNATYTDSLQFFFNPVVEGTYQIQNGVFAEYTYPAIVGSLEEPVRAAINVMQIDFLDFTEKAVYITAQNATETNTNIVPILFNYCSFNQSRVDVGNFSQIGGALYISSTWASPIGVGIINTIFNENHLSRTTGNNVTFLAGAAAGIQNIDFIWINNVTFTGNELSNSFGAGQGGALFFASEAKEWSSSYVLIENTNFTDTTIDGQKTSHYGTGGAINVIGYNNLVLINGSFIGSDIIGTAQVTGVDVSASLVGNFFIQSTHFVRNGLSTDVGQIAGGCVYYETPERVILPPNVLISASIFEQFPEDGAVVPWTVGGAMHVLNILPAGQKLSLSINGTLFGNLTGQIGGALSLVADNVCHVDSPCNCADDLMNFEYSINFCQFSGCQAAGNGAVVYISGTSAQASSPCCSAATKLGGLGIYNSHIHHVLSPRAAVFVDTIDINISNFTAFENDVQTGVFEFSNSNTGFYENVSMVAPMGSVTNETVYGFLTTGGYSTTKFRENSRVYISSYPDNLGYGMVIDPTARFTTFQIYGDNPDGIVIESVDCGGNPMCDFRASTNESPSVLCESLNMTSCNPEDPEAKCINYCRCSNSENYYCGGCGDSQTPNPEPNPQVPGLADFFRFFRR